MLLSEVALLLDYESLHDCILQDVFLFFLLRLQCAGGKGGIGGTFAPFSPYLVLHSFQINLAKKPFHIKRMSLASPQKTEKMLPLKIRMRLIGGDSEQFILLVVAGLAWMGIICKVDFNGV